MKSFLIIILFVSSQWALAEVQNMYQVTPGSSQPVLLNNVEKVSTTTLREKQMNLRIKVTKFRVTKTASGPKVNFTPVCEFNTQTPIKDLTNGGIISEENLGACESELQGKQVVVVLSGMIYDNKVADFTDETKDWTRNFFAHLSLASSEVIFGLGDFNLDTTRDPDLTHLSSSLSVDPRFGGKGNTREGFTARIRYNP